MIPRNFYEPVKNMILNLAKESSALNNNRKSNDSEYKNYKYRINPLIILAENKTLYGDKDSKYCDVNGKFQNEIQYIGAINTKIQLNRLITFRQIPITDITFMINTTNNAIEYYTNLGYVVNVLNFANSSFCGGGVEEGAEAQEEELCRTSPMLYNSLQLFSIRRDLSKSERYKYQRELDWGKKNWHNKILFAPNVVFRRRDKTHNYENIDKVFKASVITAAAPDMRTGSGLVRDQTLFNNIEKVIEHIYFAPDNAYNDIDKEVDDEDKSIFWKRYNNTLAEDKRIEHGFSKDKILLNIFPPKKKRVLLLGPWGCGAFVPDSSKANANSYRQSMALCFSNALKKLENRYDIICFTFLNNTDDNYIIFYSIFRSNGFEIIFRSN